MKEAAFKSRAIFESTVEFLAGVTFKGNITVNADTAGEVIVPSRTSKFKVRFRSSFEKKPLVYVSTDAKVEYKVVEVNTGGFGVELEPSEDEIGFRWFALLNDDDGFSRLEVVESSEQVSEVQVLEEGVVEGDEILTDEGTLE